MLSIESEAEPEPLDLVWAKCRGYPSYPALVRDGAPIVISVRFTDLPIYCRRPHRDRDPVGLQKRNAEADIILELVGQVSLWNIGCDAVFYTSCIKWL